jgi:hypothetical protein
MVTDTSERVDLVWHNARELMYTRFIVRGFPDPIDGLGARPPLGKVTGYLAIVGAVVALVRFRSKESVIIGLITIPVLALATSLTYDGQYRRCLGMLPFVMMFAGMTLGTVWEMAERQARLWGIAAALLCAATIGYAANQSLSFYFGGTFQDDANTRFVFAPEARRAWEYIDTLEDPWVYFYDTRRSILYETRGALDTDLAGAEDRSLEFAPEGERTKLRFDLQPSEKVAEAASVKPRSAVFVFLNSYTAEPNIQEVIRRYPGGVLVEHRYEKLGFYDFRAYYLPPDLLDSYARQESVSYPLKSEVAVP